MIQVPASSSGQVPEAFPAGLRRVPSKVRGGAGGQCLLGNISAL
jgi:hypothetical protein